MTSTVAPSRTVSRINESLHAGRDAQVDDKFLAFLPGNPELTDPFLLLVDDRISAPGFDWHPHRGLETVTTVLDGVLEHGDNMGHAGLLKPGDVQWMTAGRGIIHRELAHRDEHARIMQLWVNLPAPVKMTASRYQDLPAADRVGLQRQGVTLDVVSGTLDGVTGPAQNHAPIQAVNVSIDPATAFVYSLPTQHRLFVHVLTGSVDVAGRTVRAGHTAWSDPVPDVAGQSEIVLATPEGNAPATFMAYSGTPLRQPVALGGPFVMTTPAEIRQAFEDFQGGKFGPVSRQTRVDFDR